ncbi:MAG: hypothetical protein AAB524_00455 [Patescibacteria group bacterium]
MAENLRDRLLKDSPWRVILLAVALLVAGEMLLAWQYQRLEKGRLFQIEQKLEEQERTFEERAAQEVLEKFLEARVAGDTQRASRYITEEAAFQDEQELFEFFGVRNYKIGKKEKLGEGVFRFQVEVTRDRLTQVEIVEVRKISDQYYVNSVQLAG